MCYVLSCKRLCSQNGLCCQYRNPAVGSNAVLPRYLRAGKLDNLLVYDELSQEMQAKRVFQVCSLTDDQCSCLVQGFHVLVSRHTDCMYFCGSARSVAGHK